MTRVVAGTAKGRHLDVPASGTRPTSDRVREAMFSSLHHHFGSFDDVDVLDLYAGSGALGLEALSRGARRAVLVEKDRKACEVIRRNMQRVDLPGASVVADDVKRLVGNASLKGTFDLVLADPPYDLDDLDVEHVLRSLGAHGWLTDDSVVVVERQAGRTAFTWPDGYEEIADRDYGGTRVRSALWYGPNRA